MHRNGLKKISLYLFQDPLGDVANADKTNWHPKADTRTLLTGSFIATAASLDFLSLMRGLAISIWSSFVCPLMIGR